jgi:hypothetical protein
MPADMRDGHFPSLVVRKYTHEYFFASLSLAFRMAISRAAIVDLFLAKPVGDFGHGEVAINVAVPRNFLRNSVS